MRDALLRVLDYDFVRKKLILQPQLRCTYIHSEYIASPAIEALSVAEGVKTRSLLLRYFGYYLGVKSSWRLCHISDHLFSIIQ
jgi:hypothetical protein